MNKKKNRDFNPYDLNQVGKRKRRLRILRKRTQSTDPYSTRD